LKPIDGRMFPRRAQRKGALWTIHGLIVEVVKGATAPLLAPAFVDRSVQL
jgi:hypothetical protein